MNDIQVIKTKEDHYRLLFNGEKKKNYINLIIKRVISHYGRTKHTNIRFSRDRTI